mmetsp:Transcript_3327/g.2286  ORF Transcript_3327/g.2286 Transcript_3327/m.2286 type:complete len:203 (+) Transcript_3327:359-967(+)
MTSWLWRVVLVRRSGHVAELVENVEEVRVADNIIEARRKHPHELDKFAARNALHILRDNIDEVVLLDDADVVGVECAEFGVQVHLHSVLHLVDLPQHLPRLRVLQYHLLFEQTGCLCPERILLVPLQARSPKEMSPRIDKLRRRVVLSIEQTTWLLSHWRRLCLSLETSSYCSSSSPVSPGRSSGGSSSSVFRAVRVDIGVC